MKSLITSGLRPLHRKMKAKDAYASEKSGKIGPFHKFVVGGDCLKIVFYTKFLPWGHAGLEDTLYIS